MSHTYLRIRNMLLLFLAFCLCASCTPGSPTSSPNVSTVTAFDGAEDSRPELTLCSFNIQFLGLSKKRRNADLANVLKPCDVALVQELVAPPFPGNFPDGAPFKPDPEAAAFFDEMHALGFSFMLSEEDTGPGVKNHLNSSATEWWIAFYKPESVHPAADLPSGFLEEDHTRNPHFDRVPYAFPFRPANSNSDFVLISVHLHPNASSADKARREEEIGAVVEWINEHDSTEKDFLIVGDMNITGTTELKTFVPADFVSLNDGTLVTNTNPNSLKPYDDVLYRPEHTPEIDAAEGLSVIDLVNVLRDKWAENAPYPGDPYDHNGFRAYFSDHNPIVWHLRHDSPDDD